MVLWGGQKRQPSAIAMILVRNRSGGHLLREGLEVILHPESRIAQDLYHILHTSCLLVLKVGMSFHDAVEFSIICLTKQPHQADNTFGV
jgi:hypothetical protein